MHAPHKIFKPNLSKLFSIVPGACPGILPLQLLKEALCSALANIWLSRGNLQQSSTLKFPAVRVRLVHQERFSTEDSNQLVAPFLVTFSRWAVQPPAVRTSQGRELSHPPQRPKVK